jgi:hypothetical protein
MAEPRVMPPRDELRVFVAFLVQPLVAALFGLVTFPIVEKTGRPLYCQTSDSLREAAAFGFGMGLVGLLVTVFAAAPLFAWLRRLDRITVGTTLKSGALLGNLPLGVALVLGAARSFMQDGVANAFAFTYGPLGAVRAFAIGSAVGVGCAAVFWWIAGRYLNRSEHFNHWAS